MKRQAFIASGVFAVTVGVAGCADGPVAGQGTGFCDAVAARDSFTFNPQLTEEDNGTEFDLRLTELLRAAPSEVEADVETIVESVRSIDENGGMFQDALDAEERIDVYSLDNCDVEQHIEVTTSDYELRGVPASLPAGRIAVTLHNVGQEVHMVQFLKIDDPHGRSGADILTYSDRVKSELLVAGPGAYATGGITDTVFLDLVPGRHLAVDPIPIGTVMFDEDGWGEPHFTRGMFAELTITAHASEDS